MSMQNIASSEPMQPGYTTARDIGSWALLCAANGSGLPFEPRMLYSTHPGATGRWWWTQSLLSSVSSTQRPSSSRSTRRSAR